jgi:thiol-disulfide isomerase/thioredoxin
LEGIKSGNKLFLSGFDGMHAFLFIAEKQTNNTLIGVFYSGASWKESWVAKRNEAFKLNDAEQITFLKNKDETLNFSFPDLEKNQVALSDQKYKNKVVIIQVMGSWCPNCMDESRYLTNIYSKYKQQGLEIIALAFEKTTDFEKAKIQVQRMKNRLRINYDVLITQQSGTAKASEVLSAFNKISAFPTTIFLNKQHQVVKVYTGFSGPATGQEYEVYKTQTENSIEKLLRE